MRTVIVGGGIGGLAAAIALESRGHDVDVFERANEYRDVGSGLSLWPNSLAALDALGVGQEVRQRSATVSPVGILDRHGRTLSRIDPEVFARRHGEIAMIHRAELLEVLRSRVRQGTLVPGVEVSAVTPDGVVHCDGDTIEPDVVVAADGVQSATRCSLWPLAGPPRYAGYAAWRMVTEPVHLETTGEAWGRGERFGYAPLPDGRAYCFAVVNTPPGADHGGLSEIRQRFGAWHDPIPSLIEATRPEDVLYHDLYEAPRLSEYVRGRVALLGDAAHAMTPNLGQGAGQALEDAVCFAEAIDSGAGLQAYDQVRRRRTQSILLQSRRLGSVAQWSSAPAVAVRDAMLRAAPSSLTLAALAPVLDWRGAPMPQQ